MATKGLAGGRSGAGGLCNAAEHTQPHLGTRTVPLLQKDGVQFRDLNRDGLLEPYEDWRLPPGVRAADLLSRMTLAEKAGAMMHGTPPMTLNEQYDLAQENNALQAIAERGHLGIPILVSTDPRSHFDRVVGASVAAGGFTQWPGTLGLASIGDAAVVRHFADTARQEYRAVGIHMALSPQADLATEPRWPRINGTFGEDADLVGRMVEAYVIEFQHGAHGVASDGVATIVKHWVGYGGGQWF